MTAINTGKQTQDGLTVYDLDPQASELWAVAGPDGVDPSTIDPDNLPQGFRWVEPEEWDGLSFAGLRGNQRVLMRSRDSNGRL